MKYVLSIILALLPLSALADESKWKDLVQSSLEYLETRQARLESEFGISTFERWDVDQDTGTLTFSSNGSAKVVARIQIVGSFSTTSNTWLWSWGNESILPPLTAAAISTRAYGEANHFQKLVERKWKGEQADAWAMAAVTNYLLKAQGVYRPPIQTGAIFLVLTDVWKAPTQ